MAPLALLALGGCGRGSLTLATTTSTYDSGLLNDLLPLFEREAGIKVKVVAVGSGQALELGRRGDADVLLVHSPKAEEEFMAQGFGANREKVMHNDFVIVGPEADPAGIKGLKEASRAFSKIALAQSFFVSRGDGSGTEAKEKELWADAGISPQGQWYLRVGQGMGETLLMASEKGAYTLSDRGTYLALRPKLSLEVLVEGDEALLNPYHVIAVNPARNPKVKYDLAQHFIAFLLSPEAQRAISRFGVDKYGQPLFFPDAMR